MDNENYTAEKRLEIITEMIEQTKHNMPNNTRRCVAV